MLLVGSYVKLVKKPYESFPVDTTMLGKVIQIEKNNILVHYPMMNMGMSFDEYTKYFIAVKVPKMEEEPTKPMFFKPAFSEWEIFDSSFDKLDTAGINHYPYEYCSNGKVVKVRKHYLPGIKKDCEIPVGKASCYKDDKFDLGKGIRLAYARCKTKEIKEQINKLGQKLNYYTPTFWME